MTALVVVEAVAIALLGLLVASLLRSHAEILRKLHELGAGLYDEPRAPGPLGAATPIDADAHDIAGVTPHDEALTIGVAGTSHDTLLAFLSSGCSTCSGFFAEPANLPERTRLVIVTKGEADESVSAVRTQAANGVTVVMSTEAWEEYGVPGSPYFVLVDGPRGRVRGEGTASTWQQVSGLMAQALADARAGREREARADVELLAAGIRPGHPSLYE